MPTIQTAPPPVASPSDEEVARRVLAGDSALFEVLMRRHNSRVYRAVRSILRDESQVEEVMQQAYLQAYTHLGQFNGGARFSTWLLRIAVNEALMRRRREARLRLVDEPEALEAAELPDGAPPTPEERAERRELAAMLERAIDTLSSTYRSTFVLREVEGLSTAETAEALGVREEVVKTRLHRARALVREALYAAAGVGAEDVFTFHASRCDRVVTGVFAALDGRR